MLRGASLYDRIVAITTDYLGPTAPRFVDRQIQNHLGKAPADLNARDVEKLVDWARIALALLTDDSHLVDEYTSRLKALRK